MKTLKRLSRTYVNDTVMKWVKSGIWGDMKKKAIEYDMKFFLEHDDEFASEGEFIKDGNWYQCFNRESLRITYDKKQKKWFYKWYSLEADIEKYGGKGNDFSQLCQYWYCMSFKEFVVTTIEFDKGNYDKIEIEGREPDTEEDKEKARKRNFTGSEAGDIKTFTEVFNTLEWTSDITTTLGYLIKNRKISKNVVDELIQNDYIRTNKKNKARNTNFIWRDFNGDIVGTSQSGNFDFTGDRFKGIMKGSDNNYGFNVQLGERIEEEIIFFEGCEDMLSFMTLFNLTNVCLVAMCGLKFETVETYKKQYPNSKIILAVDNDKAGDTFVEFVKEQYKNVEDYREELKKTNLKDWNDYLKENKDIKKELDCHLALQKKENYRESIKITTKKLTRQYVKIKSKFIPFTPEQETYLLNIIEELKENINKKGVDLKALNNKGTLVEDRLEKYIEKNLK